MAPRIEISFLTFQVKMTSISLGIVVPKQPSGSHLQVRFDCILMQPVRRTGPKRRVSVLLENVEPLF